MRQCIKMLTLSTLCIISAPAWGQQVDLYQIGDRSPGYDKQTAAIAGVVDEVEVSLDQRAIDGNPKTLGLQLPDGRSLVASRARFVVETDYVAWIGEVSEADGPSSYIHLVDHGDQVTGILNIGSEQYQLVAAEFGHRLVRVDAPEGKVCLHHDATWEDPGAHDPGPIDPGSHSQDHIHGPVGGDLIAPMSELLSQASEVAGADKATTILDVLAVYPNVFAGSSETAMLNFVQTSVSIANDILVRSNINAQYRLVKTAKLTGAQPPATGIVDGWDWINDEPQEIANLRDEYSADFVALFVPLSYNNDPFNACAIANLPQADGSIRDGELYGITGPFGDRAFTVHRSGCGLNDLTFAHELGHNYGMRHDNEVTTSNHLFPNGRGYVVPGPRPWRDNANGSIQTNVAGHFAAGYHFTPQVDGFVVELGGYFNGTHTVKLIERSTGQIIRAQTVTDNNSWSFVPIIPFKLKANVGYTVAVYVDGGGSIFSNVATLPRVYNEVRIDGTTFISTLNDPNAIPTNILTDVMYGQADIRFAPDATVMGCVFKDGGDITGEVCSRIPHFSDPAIQYQGYTTGTPDRNNAAVGRAQVGPYSQFRVNNAPNCVNDSFSTQLNTQLAIPLGNLLGNDSDPDGDSLWLWDYDLVTAQGGSNDTGHVGGFNYTPPPGFTGTDWFTYTISDRGHSGGLTDTCTVVVQVSSNEVDFAEFGHVTNLTHGARTVVLSRSYSNPVVIAQTLSFNGSDTSVVRITNVQSDRFTYFVDEAPDRDGPHTTETVSYLVVEAGHWQLADGTELRAGKIQTSRTVGTQVVNSWQTVGYGGFFSTTPLVFSQVQTNNDADWVKTRHASVGTSSFLVALENEEASAVSHGNETIGWLAFQPGSGTWSSHAYLATRTPNVVTDAWHSLAFGASYANPKFFAAMPTYDGGNNAALRYTGLGTTGAQVRVEEDTTLNSETAHTTEVVDYLVLSGSGTLQGTQQ